MFRLCFEALAVAIQLQQYSLKMMRLCQKLQLCSRPLLSNIPRPLHTRPSRPTRQCWSCFLLSHPGLLCLEDRGCCCSLFDFLQGSTILTQKCKGQPWLTSVPTTRLERRSKHPERWLSRWSEAHQTIPDSYGERIAEPYRRRFSHLQGCEDIVTLVP